MGRALRLNAIKFAIERTNVGAETILFGDAGFQSGDVQGNDIGTRGGERGGERAEESEALFE
jgi:hypothetical protein